MPGQQQRLKVGRFSKEARLNSVSIINRLGYLMRANLKRLKDKLFYFFVLRNRDISREYVSYVDTHLDEHKKKRWKHWWMLFRLNWHYRVMKRKSPLYYTNPAPKKVKLPYLEGSESEGFKRIPSIILAKQLMSYDIISFDIFDTLILRPFANPVDLFMVVGNKLGIMNYMNIRRDAEKEAREEARVLTGTAEISIKDIYKRVSRRTGIDVDEGIKAEFETELEFCFANPYMLQVFKMLKEQGKRIIIASDMYYPKEMMEELLEHCGYKGYEKIYVSCDYLCNKRTGGLYKYILRDFSGCSIAHVGDNMASDIQSAEKQGIRPFYYQNCHEIGNPYRADGMSELVGSFYSGIVNTHLHNGVKTYSPYYEFGFIYGGLYIFGYCNWIHEKAKQEGIDKILFLSRDGYIYQKVFNMLFDDMPNEYVYWSRIASLKATLEFDRVEFLKRVVANKAYLPNHITLEDMLRAVSLENMIGKLADYKLHADDILVPELVKRVEDFLIANWEKIVEHYDKASEPLRCYFSRIIAGCKKVAVVDVGWLGTGPKGIKTLIEKKWGMDCTVKCYIAASAHPIGSYSINEVMDRTVEPYMFSRMYNRNLFDTHTQTNRGMNNALWELFAQANQPSFTGFSQLGDFQFDIVEISNYPINTEIQRGIVEFCRLYTMRSKENPYLRNIAGYEVYLPFRMLIRDLSLLSKVFQNYYLSLEPGCNWKEQKQETIGDAMRQRGVYKGA